MQGFHTKGVCSVNFSSSGRYLVSVGIDDQHSIAVHKWADGKYSFISDTKHFFINLFLNILARIAFFIHIMSPVFVIYLQT